MLVFLSLGQTKDTVFMYGQIFFPSELFTLEVTRGLYWSPKAHSAGAVEYTDCVSAEG